MHTSLAGENVIILQEENGCVKNEGVVILDSALHAVLGLHCCPCMSHNFTYVCLSLCNSLYRDSVSVLDLTSSTAHQLSLPVEVKQLLVVSPQQWIVEDSSGYV